MNPRKQPGVAFWATVVATVALVYLLSLGPATWLAEQRHLSNGAMTTLYAPVFAAYENAPRPIRLTTDWYVSLSSKKSDEGILFDPVPGMVR